MTRKELQAENENMKKQIMEQDGLIRQQSVQIENMLPESEQELASRLIKQLVLAWDPDFTKLTPEERKRLEAAEERVDSGEYVKDSDVEW